MRGNSACVYAEEEIIFGTPVYFCWQVRDIAAVIVFSCWNVPKEGWKHAVHSAKSTCPAGCSEQ